MRFARKLGMAALWLAGIPAALVRFRPGTAEYWCANILPPVRAALASLSSALPLGALLLTLFLAALIVRALRRGVFLPWLAALVLMCFTATWLAPLSVSESAPAVQTDRLAALCVRLADEAALFQAQMQPLERESAPQQAALLCETAIVPKAARFPRLADQLGLAGWWSPLTSEAIVDMTLSDLNLPFTLCHELMHARGIASEALANYAAYLLCRKAGGAFAYSGTMNAFWYAMRALRSCDEGAWQAIVSGMQAPVLADFARMNGLSEAQGGFPARLQTLLTDAYLFLTATDDYAGFVGYLCLSDSQNLQ